MMTTNKSKTSVIVCCLNNDFSVTRDGRNVLSTADEAMACMVTLYDPFQRKRDASGRVSHIA